MTLRPFVGALCAFALLPSTGGATARPSVTNAREAPLQSHFRGARPSVLERRFGNQRRYIQLSSQIQHVVVIVMENRTVDDLFAAYYGQRFPGGGSWQAALNLYNPNNPAQPLTQNSLSAAFDPNHGHNKGFALESSGKWSSETFGCPGGKTPMCPPSATAYSYVPSFETDVYRQLVTNWAFADNMLQANEGPSFPAHQYLVAAQSGGVSGALTSPLSEAENPQKAPVQPDPPGNYGEDDNTFDMVPGGQFCDQSTIAVSTLNMLLKFSQLEGSNPTVAPCEEYGANQNATILDEISQAMGPPQFMDWQYIAHSTASIWAAPMAINHLYNKYAMAPNKATQPFAADPDAVQFISDIGSAHPLRPLAALTYITPCVKESDHPLNKGTSDGPEWLATVVNAIGESAYWPHTAIIVTWDDWGGFFDHVPAVPPPFHPYPNAYPIPNFPNGNPSDPYEYGFRVPLMVISPYVRRPAYVSTTARSSGSIMHFVEDIFNLPSLNADDAYNDDLSDLFNFQQNPGLPYTPIVNFSAPNLGC